jgi:hypothetical protein
VGQAPLEPTVVDLWHFNGLPPAGPRTAAIKLGITPGCEAPPAGPVKKDTYRKPTPGEIDDVVQAVATDKAARPKQWKTWQ